MRMHFGLDIEPEDRLRVVVEPAKESYGVQVPESLRVDIMPALNYVRIYSRDHARQLAFDLLGAIGEPDYRAALADVIGYAESRAEDMAAEVEEILDRAASPTELNAATEGADRARTAVERARKLLADGPRGGNDDGVIHDSVVPVVR